MITSEIAQAAFQLLRKNEHLDKTHSTRLFIVRVCKLQSIDTPFQLDLFFDGDAREKQEMLDGTIFDLRRRFGNTIVRRAETLGDDLMTPHDIKKENVVHLVGSLR